MQSACVLDELGSILDRRNLQMKKLALLACVVIACAASRVNAVEDWTAEVAYVQASSISQDCIYFTLAGIEHADPAAPSQWFAIPRSQYGSRDAYAMRLMARATAGRVRVTTTGSTICGGYAQVSQVILVP
jgi:hypothetical protein